MLEDCEESFYFIDPEDKEFKETIRNARRKLETPMAPTMLCKTCKKKQHGETRSKTNDFKSKFACILEASEPTRVRMEESLPNYHEDHIAGKGDNSLQHHDLVHGFIPVSQAMKIPAARAAVDKEWENLKKIPAWDVTKVRSKKEVIDEARTNGRKVHFASLMDIVHFMNVELETKHQKYKGRVVLRGDIVKDDLHLLQYSLNKDHQHHKWLQQKSWNIIYRLPDKHRTQCLLFPGQNGRCSKIIENSKIGMSRHLDSSTTTQMAQIMVQYGGPSRSSWTKSVWSSFGRTVMEKAIWENPIEIRLGEGFQSGMLIRTSWKRIILICVCGWHQIGWKEAKSDVDSTEQVSWLGRTNIIPWSWIPGVLKDNVK